MVASPAWAQREQCGKLAIRSVKDSTEPDPQITQLSTITFWLECQSWNANVDAVAGQVELEEKEYQIRFEQIYLSKPTMTEADGETNVLFPMHARLRNLT